MTDARKARIHVWIYTAAAAAAFGVWLNNIAAGVFMLVLLLLVEEFFRVFVLSDTPRGMQLEASEKMSADRAKFSAPADSSLQDLTESVEVLRKRAEFQPYYVGIHFNRSNVRDLLRKIRLLDGDQWINGVKWSEAESGRDLWQGIRFLVLSADECGHPQVVYRIDGTAPQFQMGLCELSRTIEEASLERSDELFGSGIWRPCLFFGSGLGRKHGSYELGIEVQGDWWEKISDKPTDVERHQEIDSGSLYLVLARLPYSGISEDHRELLHEIFMQDKKLQLEQHGWALEEEHGICELTHKYFTVSRHDLTDTSLVGNRFEWKRSDTA